MNVLIDFMSINIVNYYIHQLDHGTDTFETTYNSVVCAFIHLFRLKINLLAQSTYQHNRVKGSLCEQRQ